MKLLRSILIAAATAFFFAVVPYYPAEAVTYKILFSNNAATTLATGISSSSTSLQVVSGGGALFPVVGTNQAFIATLISQSNPNTREIVFVRGRSGDNFTSIIRAYGTSPAAASWIAGDIVALLQPAEAMALFVQFGDLQSQTTNYAPDSGTSSAYRVTLSPSINASIVGMPIRFMASHANVANPTFSDGITTASLIVPGIAGVPANAMRAGGIYVVHYDGSTFQLSGSQRFDMILGQVSNAQVPQSAVTQYQAALAIATSQLTGTITSGQLASSLALSGAPTSATSPAISTVNSQLATTASVNGFIQRGRVHVGDVSSPAGGSVSFSSSFSSSPRVTVTVIDANNHGASVVAALDGLPTTSGFNWAAREISSAVEDIYIDWMAVSQ